MDPRLAGFTQRLQSIPGAPVSSDEIADRVQYLYARLKGLSGRRPQVHQEGGRLPNDLAKRAKQELFSKGGAFPMTGGANFLEGLASKAQGFAESDKGASLIGKVQGMVDQPKPDPMTSLLGQVAPGASGVMTALSTGNLGALPRAKGPSLEAFLESQGVPQIPIKTKKVPGDFLGNTARWWVKAAASPYLGTLVKLSFFFLFFISFLESTPLIGSAMSVALDAMLAGGRILVKILQKGVPAMMGLIPLPYSQLVGVVLVSVIGMFVWTILAVVSFSRQDFTSAIDSMLRIIPVPIGDALADSFLDLNRTWDQFSDKRIKLTDDVWNALLLFQQFIATASQYVQSASTGAVARVKAGTSTLLDAIRGIRGPAPPAPAPAPETPAPVPTPEAPAPPAPAPPPEAPAPAPAPAPPPVSTPEAPAPPPVSTPEAPAPAPAPVPETPAPAPAPEPPTTFEMGRKSALDRLRTQKTSFTAPKQLQGGKGKRLSTKTRRVPKWKTQTHPLYERFYGLGSR